MTMRPGWADELGKQMASETTAWGGASEAKLPGGAHWVARKRNLRSAAEQREAVIASRSRAGKISNMHRRLDEALSERDITDDDALASG